MTARGIELTIDRLSSVRLGLAENRGQFALLVVINAFVGAMVGLERSVLPLVAAGEFRIASATAALSFIATFGLAKAMANFAAGALVDRHGRRRVLVVGWLVALPVPLLILFARDWWWIVAANALLGVNQGLAWSATVIMKIDLVGPRRRGVAMGLNEFAGYLAVAIAAFASGLAATSFGLREGPAYVGLGVAIVGLALSLSCVRDTGAHVALEASMRAGAGGEGRATATQLLRRSLWSDRSMFSVSQAGLVNNLNDGLAWGVFPLLFAGAALSLTRVSALVAIYPAVWGVAQLATGPLSDRWGRKRPIVAGMIVQGLALFALAFTSNVAAWVGALVGLGVGTALVYPTLLAAVGDTAAPSSRGAAVGVYRLWRDLGYVIGALMAGLMADAFGIPAAIAAIAALTVVSGIVFAFRFQESHNAGGS